MRFSAPLALAVLLTPTLLLTACAGPAEPAGHDIASIRVAPSELDMVQFDSMRISSYVRNRSGQVMDIHPVWTTTDSTIVSVDNHGLIRGRRSGQAVVIARIGLLRDSAVVNVRARIIGGEPFLSLVPERATLHAGDTLHFVITSGWDGDSFRWTTSDSTVAQLLNASGLVRAVAPGQAAISAVSVLETTRHVTANITVLP